MRLGIRYAGIVRCHWHGTAYKLQTGELIDGPGLLNLPVYKVHT